MMTLDELCARVAGRVTLLVEIKSRFARDERLVARTVEVLKSYAGPVAAMSFDPHLVACLRHMAPALARGVVTERHFTHAEWAGLSAWQRTSMAHLLHAARTRPDFVAYRVDDLPAPATRLMRWFGAPVLTWTVRTVEQRERATQWADQVIFEGFRG
jgi:glycerophosphoryl diester phosphodiesterase